jgi:CubicO group peptidase (beta-lactamase class C family)
MKRILLAVLTLSLVCALLTSCASENYSELANELDDYFTNYYGGFSGSVLVAVDGKIVLKKGYGMADYEKQIPNTPQTEFKIGSITKQFTAMSIMMLEERGLLSVKDPITKYIPDFKGGDKITIHHLLSMSSGIEEYLYSDWGNCNHNYKVEDTIQGIKSKPIIFEAGTEYHYSNSNYALLGYIIEQASGVEYGEFLKKNIFEPLKMKNTCYDYKEDQLKNKAIGYSAIFDITRKDNILSNVMDMSYPYAAGGLYSTVEDLYKWDQALYTEKLVKKETLEKIFTPNLGNYGYGWNIPIEYKAFVCHSGHVSGFISSFQRYMEHKGVVAILTNEENGSQMDRISEEIVEMAERHKLLTKTEP